MTRLLVLVCALGLGGRALAQNEVVDADKLPAQYSVGTPDTWVSADQQQNPWWRERVQERFRQELSDGRYAVVLRRLSDDFRDESVAGVTELTARFHERMVAVTTAFEHAVLSVGVSTGLETVAQRSLVDQEMLKAGYGVQSLDPQPLTDPLGIVLLTYFSRSDDDPGLPTAAVTPEGKYELLVPRGEMLRIRLAADAFHFVLGHFIAPVQDAQFEALKKADTMWRGYLFDGYSQYPWESLFNGWVLDFKAFEPPERQWILFHPSIAFEASTVSLDEIQADEVLAVELLGHLWYYDENQEYWGVSFTSTLHDQLSPGLGLLAHWSNKISLGVTWHDLDDDDHYFDEDPFVLLSVDLFGYLQTQGPAFREKYDVVRGLLGR